MSDDIKKNVEIVVTLKDKQAKAGMKSLGNEAKSASNKIKGNFSSSLAASATSALALGSAVAIIGDQLKKTINVGKEFESTMSKVKAISGASADEFKRLQEQALKLGANTSFTANEVGNLQVEFSKLGFTAEEIDSVTEATLNLAKAAGEDLATSAGVAGGVVRAYGLQASEAGRVTDVMAKAFTTSALDLQKFKVAIGQAGKIASDAGLSIEETSAALGLMANQNIRAETSGVGLKNILLKLNQEGSKVADILGGGAEGFDELIHRLDVASKDADKFKQAQKELGTENAVVFSSLVGNVDKLREYSAELKNSRGEAKKMALIMEDNLQGDFDKLNSAVDGMRISISKAFDEDARSNVQEMTSVISDMTPAVTKLVQAGGLLWKYWTMLPRAIADVSGTTDIKKALQQQSAQDIEFGINALSGNGGGRKTQSETKAINDKFKTPKGDKKTSTEFSGEYAHTIATAQAVDEWNRGIDASTVALENEVFSDAYWENFTDNLDATNQAINDQIEAEKKLEKQNEEASKRVTAEQMMLLSQTENLWVQLNGIFYDGGNGMLKTLANITNLMQQAMIAQQMLAASTSPFGAVGAGLSFLSSGLLPLFAADGADFTADKPTMMVVGEKGREKVSVTPLTGTPAPKTGGGGGNTININLSGGATRKDADMVATVLRQQLDNMESRNAPARY